MTLLMTACHAADSVHKRKNCPVYGGDGPYSYDPTSLYGPSHWGDKPETHTCKDGHHQSPIDFPMPNKTMSMDDGPVPMMAPGRFKLSAGSFNWAANCVEPSTCGHTLFGGKQYFVLGVHFHTPSEHMLDGKRYPLEAHIVHASADGKLAVLATMFDYADKDSYAARVFATVPQESGTSYLLAKLMHKMKLGVEELSLDLRTIVKPKEGYCSYVGSLTTPPCSEGVTFMMAMHTETVTERQVAIYRLSSGLGADGNNRPQMPLNSRKVTCYV